MGIVLLSWFLAVNTVILAGMWKADPFSVGVNVVGPVLLLVVLASMKPLRYAVMRIPTESLIYIQSLRIWGLLLLPFSGAGVVATWAVPVATAEIAIGLMALPLGYLAGAELSRGQVALLWTWSLLGLASAVLAPASAIWHSVLNNNAMQALAEYPLALVPSYFMPLAITAHILFIRRLASWQPPLEEANDLSS